jgi:hypothetical protein
VILSCDPGIRGCGVAAWEGTSLVRASYVRNPMRHGNGPVECRAMAHAIVKWWEKLVGGPWYATGPEHIACERPRIYTASKQHTDPNDLPPLLGIDCALAAFFPDASVTCYFPEQWKGQLEKHVMNERVISRLTPLEHRRVEWCAEDLMHNVWDGIGLGLKYVGRLERKRVFAR